MLQGQVRRVRVAIRVRRALSGIPLSLDMQVRDRRLLSLLVRELRPGRHRLPAGSHLAGGDSGSGAAVETPGWGQPLLPDLPGRPQGPRHSSPASPRPAGQPTTSTRANCAAIGTMGGRGPDPRHPPRPSPGVPRAESRVRPARAGVAAKQWGGTRSREEVELLGPRVTSAAWDENAQPSQHRVATVTRRAVQARLQARQQRTAARAEQTRTRELAARTHQRLLARQRQAGGSRPQRTREECDRER
jgi:hypothetical protein